MDDMLVSVIIPTYNHASYIKYAIDSALDQTYKSIEVVVVDNYSTDGTQELIDSYQDKRLKYIKFSNNGVIASSRNYGVQQSSGACIAFLDSDDVWDSNKIQCQMEIFANDPNCGLVSGCLQSIDGEGNKQNKVYGNKYKQNIKQTYNKLIYKNTIVTSSVLIRRCVFDELKGFDETNELICAEDFDLWLRVARKYSMLCLMDILGYYRVHENNMNLVGQRIDKAVAVLDKHYRQKWISVKQLNNAKASFYIQVGFGVIENAEQAREYFKKAYKHVSMNVKYLILCVGGLCLTYMPFFIRLLKFKGC